MHDRDHAVHDRAAGRNHHDHEHEHRFGEIACLDVALGFFAPGQQEQHGHEDEGPEAEHHLHFRQQMPEARMAGLHVGQMREKFGREGVDYGDAENYGSDDFWEERGRRHGGELVCD